jgi:hypothetical protein
MKIKTSEATPRQLNWLAAKCEGITPIAVKKKYSEGYILYSIPASTVPLEYSTNWAQGGPIIEREKITVMHVADRLPHQQWHAGRARTPTPYIVCGPTPLIAAMRCYVASKLGDEVDVPEELK